MDRLIVRRSSNLSGEVKIGGAKNSVIKLMAATILAPGVTTLSGVPAISDVTWMGNVLTHMGATVHDVEQGVIHIDIPQDMHGEAPYEFVERMRGSTAIMGAALARLQTARVALPGGDDFGHRPIDMHLQAFAAMGAHITETDGYVVATAKRLHGTTVHFDFPSVGATENVMMAAALADGKTVINNAAREPEIADLAAFLNRMGGRVLGAGTSCIEIEGVDQLHPVEHHVVPDRIEAATFLCLLGAAGGELLLRNAKVEHLSTLLKKLGEMGMRVSPDANGLWAQSNGHLCATQVATLPYPGLATDILPLFVALAATAEGTSLVTENIFAGRFRYMEELAKMGADITVDGHHALIRGKNLLTGATVNAHDIRAAAALIIAGVRAEGETHIADAFHLARGYEYFVARCQNIGVQIESVG